MHIMFSCLQALPLALSLNMKSELVHIYNMQAVCQERLNLLSDAYMSAQKMIAVDPKSPKGYLRAGKLLRQMKKLPDAIALYKLGLHQADQSSSFYAELERQYDVSSGRKELLARENSQNSLGHLSAMPIGPLSRVLSLLASSERVNFSATNSSARTLMLDLTFGGHIGTVSLAQLSTVVAFSKLNDCYRIFERNLMSISTCSSTSIKAFLSFMLEWKHNQPSKYPRIKQVALRHMNVATCLQFSKCLKAGFGKRLVKLELYFDELDAANLANLVIDVLGKCPNLRCFILYTNRHFAGSCPSQSTNVSKHENLLEVSCNSGLVASIIMNNCINLKFLNCIDPALSITKPLLAARINKSVTSAGHQIKHLCIDFKSQDMIETHSMPNFAKCTTLSLCNWRCFPEAQEIWPDLCALSCLKLQNVTFGNNPNATLHRLLSSCAGLKYLEISEVCLDHIDILGPERGLCALKSIISSLPQLEHLILRRLNLGHDALTYLSRSIRDSKLTKLRVLGFIEIDTQMAITHERALLRVYQSHRPFSYLLTTEKQYRDYTTDCNFIF